MRGRDGSAISYFQSDEVPLNDVASMIPLGRVDGAGVMHTGAEVTADALAVVRRHFDGQLMAYPDSGYFEMPDWRFVDVIAPARGLTRSQVDRGSGVVWPVGGT